MIVICEECGKKYQIDPSRIKATGAKAKCTGLRQYDDHPQTESKTRSQTCGAATRVATDMGDSTQGRGASAAKRRASLKDRGGKA